MSAVQQRIGKRLRSVSMPSKSQAITVTGGRIVGTMDRGMHVFRGIPYAAPLSGANRWRPPQPVQSWSGVREVTSYGAACHQPPRYCTERLAMSVKPVARVFSNTLFLQTLAREGDDCLNLNVWTPSLDPEAKLPVLVWIHGGSFVYGTGAAPPYDGRVLASRGLVIVTLNYRLNLWGFLGGDGLFPGDLGLANRAFRDQLQALRWVHENIRAFGGDRDCVTVMGQSAGATSAVAMASSPATRGLMHRLVSMSSAADSHYPHDDLRRFARDFFQSALRVAPGDAEALVRLDVSAVQHAPGTLPYLMKHRQRYGALGRDHFSIFAMAIGTELLPWTPEDAIRAKPGLDVLIGTCRDEARIWTTLMPLPRWLGARFMFRVQSGIMFPKDRSELTLRNYRKAMPGISTALVRERAMSDAMFRRASVRYADVHSALHPGRTFLYRFDWQSPALGGTLGAIHGIDIAGAFQTYEWMLPILGSEATARPAGDALHEAIVSFVKTGKARAAALPDWQRYDTTNKACMVFDTRSELRHDIDATFEAIW